MGNFKVILISIILLIATGCYNRTMEDVNKEIADSLRVADSLALTKVDTCTTTVVCDSSTLEVKTKCNGK